MSQQVFGRNVLGIVQYFVRIYKSEQRSDYSWPTHPSLNPNIHDQIPNTLSHRTHSPTLIRTLFGFVNPYEILDDP